ncbi:hypothetical protein BATDEDRAFT_36655 [Batrachochytrium dendrobatidis JAM81]|uniref:Uncharacterized protein n=1 Tax=Batrachochytrium dendrobatidis (strain JAM81 / FGSC 10211) TaxID=684364 RepID=F4NWK8_BATDJ|nr:uncharacterized protein BATDEDRAFT_36655 [Batrachochytrium dendrobatidis JAM81]EGF82845.1 hypothetical protein BATDEDRAFT_36655 [Batrachochytrium dendrobatidis JAM81]|eukprot:XP_006676862.1 hypothetical protein BATDEDRAFT_36655 [Batrachochytrium dendrobatidis JAM81]
MFSKLLSVARPISGVMRSPTSEVTTAVKAAPITRPTARSTTFPLLMNALKSSKTFPTALTLLNAAPLSLEELLVAFGVELIF